jgi:hypothetical protein
MKVGVSTFTTYPWPLNEMTLGAAEAMQADPLWTRLALDETRSGRDSLWTRLALDETRSGRDSLWTIDHLLCKGGFNLGVGSGEAMNLTPFGYAYERMSDV